MIPTEQNSEYVVCPVCSGLGRSQTGFTCEHCNGIGVGVFLFSRFFFWGPRLGKAIIELKHIRDRVHKVIDFLALIAGLFGLFALGYWVYGVSKIDNTFRSFLFWEQYHLLILVFWVSIIFDMFLIYRMSEKNRKRHRIKEIKYDKKNQKQIVPDNWESLKRAKAKLRVDVSEGFSDDARRQVEQAYLLTAKLEHAEVTPMHLFFVCLSNKEVAALFSRLNISPNAVLDSVKTQLEKEVEGNGRTELSNQVKEILTDSYLDAMKLGQKKVSAKNFLIPIMKKDEIIREILYELEIDIDKIFNVILWFVINEKQVESYKLYKKMARYKPGTNMDRAYTSVATPTLNHFAYDLTIAAKWGRLEYSVAREKEINEIWQNIESGANGIILTGPIGVGKKTVIGGIAQLMVKENVPSMFQDKRLVELDASRLISGVDPSQAEGRMLKIIDEIMMAGNIILYIANIQNIIGITSGAEESLDLSEVLAVAINRHNIYCLASATEQNYTKFIEGKSLGNVMTRVKIDEPVGNQAIQIVESKIGAMEGKYKVFFSYNAIEESIKLTGKFIHDRYLPDKAIKILESSAIKVLKSKGEQSIVGKDDVASVISEKTGIPATKLSQNESEKLLNLEDRIHERMIGQKEAVKMVSASLRRARTNLREGKRPIANFLFLGPTGVGKTELAKTISEVFFGKEEYMIRVDMSEYQHPDSVKKMIGDAQGGLGYLTEKVRKTPFSLVLLDELEKAHPDILNLFLQVMDDGRLTDGQGKTIDFTNSIIIATSNVGSQYIQKAVFEGIEVEKIKEELINNILVKEMKPEFVNRFDGVIVFEPLSQENVVDIARLMLKEIGKMLEEKGIYFHIEEKGLRVLAREGYDPKFGARPLRRLLLNRIDDKIASLILEGKLKRRDKVLIRNDASVTVEKGKVL